MNIRAYIVSGVIEDYCLGFMSTEEMAAVAQNAAKYGEIRVAIKECEEILKKYAEDYTRLDDELGKTR